jgi:hypothetical protein
MQITKFYGLLALTSILGLVVALSLAGWLKLSAHDRQFINWSLIFFVLLNSVMYHAGQYATAQTNIYLFSHVSLFFTVSKLLLGMLLVLAFWKRVHPQSKFFIIPFLGIYFVFVIFETYFMVKLARKSK